MVDAARARWWWWAFRVRGIPTKTHRDPPARTVDHRFGDRGGGGGGIKCAQGVGKWSIDAVSTACWLVARWTLAAFRQKQYGTARARVMCAKTMPCAFDFDLSVWVSRAFAITRAFWCIECVCRQVGGIDRHTDRMVYRRLWSGMHRSMWCPRDVLTTCGECLLPLDMRYMYFVRCVRLRLKHIWHLVFNYSADPRQRNICWGGHNYDNANYDVFHFWTHALFFYCCIKFQYKANVYSICGCTFSHPNSLWTRPAPGTTILSNLRL